MTLGGENSEPFEASMISYTADRIGCEIVDGVLIAGVGNEATGYVLFQRGTTPETGANEPPYFEFDDQHNGGTDILQSVTLTPELLSIKANTDVDQRSFAISLHASAEDVELLASQLRKIFAGYEDQLHVELTKT